MVIFKTSRHRCRVLLQAVEGLQNRLIIKWWGTLAEALFRYNNAPVQRCFSVWLSPWTDSSHNALLEFILYYDHLIYNTERLLASKHYCGDGDVKSLINYIFNQAMKDSSVMECKHYSTEGKICDPQRRLCSKINFISSRFMRFTYSDYEHFIQFSYTCFWFCNANNNKHSSGIFTGISLHMVMTLQTINNFYFDYSSKTFIIHWKYRNNEFSNGERTFPSIVSIRVNCTPCKRFSDYYN